MTLTPKQLAAIRERADAATPGPWEIEDNLYQCVLRTPNRHRAFARLYCGDTVHNIPNYGTPKMMRADAAFIRAARDDVPALLAEVERLTHERDEWQARVKELKDSIAEILQWADDLRLFANEGDVLAPVFQKARKLLEAKTAQQHQMKSRKSDDDSNG